MKAILDDGSIVDLPATPALSRKSISSALVHKKTGLIAVYDESNLIGAVLNPGNERWECWTPITREEFIDAIQSVADEMIGKNLTTH